MPPTFHPRSTPRRLAAAVLLLLLSAAAGAHGPARPAPADPERQIRFPDVPGFYTLIADLHTHSVFSDGHVWPRIRVGEALRDGLDVLAVTEHLEWQPHRDDLPNPDRNRAYAETVEGAEGTDLLVVAGAEITREPPAGHMNALFVSDVNTLLRNDIAGLDPADPVGYYAAAHELPAEAAVRAARDQRAFVFWNHPDWTEQQPDGLARITGFHRALVETGNLHGIEVANGQGYSAEAFQIALDYDLVLLGVSDVHELIDWDYNPHDGGHRPVTLVFAEERSVDGVRTALFAGRTVVWFKNLLLGRPQYLLPLLDAALRIDSARVPPDTQVVEVVLGNDSDARFILHNVSGLTFAGSGDIVEIPGHSSIKLTAKPGQPGEFVALTFEVLNALTAPGAPARLTFAIAVQGQ